MSESRGGQSSTGAQTVGRTAGETVVNDHIALRLRRPDLSASVRDALNRIRSHFEEVWALQLSDPRIQEALATADNPTLVCEAIAFQTFSEVGQQILQQIRSTLNAKDVNICDDICGEWKGGNGPPRPGPSGGPGTSGPSSQAMPNDART